MIDDPDPSAILASAPLALPFFEGFDETRVAVTGGEVFCRRAGRGTPLLLLHGYPQTSAMWHRIAPALARDYEVICADLRGYGRSSKPVSSPDHTPYSKRAMAVDLLEMMDHFGHREFLVGAHDRGARVGHRMAADWPGRVMALAMLDIAPTREMYRDGGADFAQSYWHWYWLTQPEPLPERLIGADPDWFWFRKCCSGSAGAAPFYRQAIEEYLTAFRDPASVHAMCEDYRAARTVDVSHDEAETTLCPVPTLALWGDQGAIEAHFDCLALWQERMAKVEGHSLPGGHYLAEEVPGLVLDAWRPFFAQHAA